MGLFTKILEHAAGQQQDQQNQMSQGLPYDFGPGYTGGQPLPSMAPPILPPSIDRETMELYLKVKTPKNPENLTGNRRYWVFTDDDTATEVPTSNLDVSGQQEILTDLQIAIDFDGCDNCDGLVNDKMIMTHGRVLTDKARSDYGDKLRERVMPSVGISMTGRHNSDDARGERPRENRSIFGLFKQNNHGGGGY